MKKSILTAIAVVVAAAATAQNIIVVDSQKVLESMTEYKRATEQLEELSQAYQAGVEAKFEAVEQLFNNYAARKSSYSTAQAQTVEREILAKEREATEYQEKHFGAEGTVVNRQKELMEPIETKVRKAIETYATANKVLLVLDSNEGAGGSILYQNNAIDRTQQIINALK